MAKNNRPTIYTAHEHFKTSPQQKKEFEEVLKKLGANKSAVLRLLVERYIRDSKK